MGDLHSWPAHSNGEAAPALMQPSPPNPDPSSIEPATWLHGEQAAKEVIQQVHPTVSSEGMRREVVGFIQRVIRQYTGAEVCPFGSVPLKTYLPDGDIDLTAVGLGPNFEENLPNEVKNVLDMEERKNGTWDGGKFEVKDVQLIHAEVKLVKCLVQNIIVDISFNQIGGLYTLCFLEQVDQLIGKDHLFKRSIMLIKSWCYYESRILGAHHGLISTYALETLVLYIFHVFHKTLDAPLAVLYRFLDYYSKFDWENYGVSLFGPINLANLPDLIPDTPETPVQDRLIQEEFITQCLDKFTVPLRPTENKIFTKKNLNIVDPLKVSNNLGRSVSKGNFYRIRSAFIFGARKLGRILTPSNPADVTSVSADVSAFFWNTLERHGSGAVRPDISPSVDSMNTNNNNHNNINNEFVEEESSQNLLEASTASALPSPAIYHAPHMFFHNNNNNNNNNHTNSNNDDSISNNTNNESTNNNNDSISTNTNINNHNNNDNNSNSADLSGDMKVNRRYLRYAQECQLNYPPPQAYMHPVPIPIQLQTPVRMQGPVRAHQVHGGPGPYPFRRPVYGVPHFAPPPPGPGGYYMLNGVLTPAGAPVGGFGGEESPKPRGTGTYFPMQQNYRGQQNYNNRSDRMSPRSKNPNPPETIRPINTGRLNPDSSATPVSSEDSVSIPDSPANQMVPPQSPNSRRWVGNNGGGNSGIGGSNGIGGNSNRQVEFGSLGTVVLPPVSPGNRLGSGNQRKMRNSQVYQLKDEGDFPPLSG